MSVKPTLTDLLTIESSVSICFSYAHETEFLKEFSVVDNQLTLLVHGSHTETVRMFVTSTQVAMLIW